VIKAIEKNYVFLNGDVVKKQAQSVKIGDRIIIKGSKELLQIKVCHFAAKRKSYEIAKEMYEMTAKDILKAADRGQEKFPTDSHNNTRPDKKSRRLLIQLKKGPNFLSQK
jgi:ribosomal 50S subunit-recycling heat shock protein